MKIDRLIGILSILLQQEKVTAPYLAEKFEVSRRTISRDIEDLCKAGIPVVTAQGTGGGISIMDGYRMDRTLLTSGDMQAILAGLRSLDSVCGTNRYQQLMEKLAVGNSAVLTSNDHILIDLSSWYKSSLAPKIALIQEAIEEKRKLSFLYYSPKGESKRTVEPCLLIFRWASWYVWGYCDLRGDYRMFKLNRMLHLEKTGETCGERERPPFSLDNDRVFPWNIRAKVRVSGEYKWRLIEEFGIDSFTEQKDGTLIFTWGFTDGESLFSWLLSFGEGAELVEPEPLREAFARKVKRMAEKYGE